jgi:very-short-patch-repair endonuclease
MLRQIIPYNPRLKERARALRKNMTRAEALLWTRPKGKQMYGCDFDRQRPLDEYIVDFYCKKLYLAIEVDGWSHALKGVHDVARQKRLESLGVRFLRFTEQEVVADLQLVTDQIEMWIQQQKSKQPTPGPSGGGEQVAGEPTPNPSVGGEQAS